MSQRIRLACLYSKLCLMDVAIVFILFIVLLRHLGPDDENKCFLSVMPFKNQST